MIATLLFAIVAQGLPQATGALTVDKGPFYAGGKVTGHISVTFPDGYHGYQNPPTDPSNIPVTVALGSGTKFKIVKVNYPKGVPTKVAGEDKPIALYTDTISIPFTLKAPAKAGAAVLAIKVGYQQCNADACLPPDTINLSAKVTVKPKKS